MNKDEWLKTCKDNWSDFIALMERWHPMKRRINPAQMTLDELFDSPTITAPNAEKACESIRRQIVKESDTLVIAQANKALENGDVSTIYRILNQVWFGAPESRSVMSAPGFSLVCDLLSDPPE